MTHMDKVYRFTTALFLTMCGLSAAAQSSDNSTDTAINRMSFDDQVSFAKSDLASRANVDVNDIIVISAKEVQWSNGALGCPKEDASYTMAVTPGLQILLSVHGTIYHYHARLAAKPFHCPADRVEAPGFGPGTEIM